MNCPRCTYFHENKAISICEICGSSLYKPVLSCEDDATAYDNPSDPMDQTYAINDRPIYQLNSNIMLNDRNNTLNSGYMTSSRGSNEYATQTEASSPDHSHQTEEIDKRAANVGIKQYLQKPNDSQESVKSKLEAEGKDLEFVDLVSPIRPAARSQEEDDQERKRMTLLDYFDHNKNISDAINTSGMSREMRTCQRCLVELSESDKKECSVCGEILTEKSSRSLKYSKSSCAKCGLSGHNANKCTGIRALASSSASSDKTDRDGPSPEVNKYFPSVLATDGIIELLHGHFMREESSIFDLCCPCPHISQKGVEGAQWSCGYRNIQMLCCALMTITEYRSILFNGNGEVPDINGLQSWIEKAWRDGFDVEVINNLRITL